MIRKSPSYPGLWPGLTEPALQAGKRWKKSFTALGQEACMAGRTIAIGDIHGCAKALAALLDAIGPVQEDTLVPLGDFIDCGPDSRDVLEQLIALPRRCCLVPILGNHEE